MAERRIPIAGIIVGGFLLGAGVFGLYRGLNAEPIPAGLPPVNTGGALPVPSMPVIEPVAASSPPIVTTPLIPKLPAPALPGPTGPLPGPFAEASKPAPLPMAPLPVPAFPEAPKALDSVPLPVPSLDPQPIPQPKLETLAPLPKPEVKPNTDPIPSPVDLYRPFSGDSKPVEPAPLAPAKPEINLRPVDPANTLKPVETPPTTVLPLPAPAPLEVLPPPRKFEEPKPVEAPKPSLPTPIPQPEETAPMKKAVLTATLGAALTATPTVLAEDLKPVDTKVIEAIQKDVKDLQAELKAAKEQKKELELFLYGPRDGKIATTPNEMGVLKRLEKAEAEAKAMDEKVKKLEEKLAQKTVTEKKEIPKDMAGKATIRLVNEYRVKVSIMVNGKSYPLELNEVKEIVVPEGEFKHELIEFPNSAPVKSTIKEGEVVTLRIR